MTELTKRKEGEPQNVITKETVQKRVGEIFDGVDFSKSGQTSLGQVDFNVRVDEREVRATAQVHGFGIAHCTRYVGNEVPGDYTDIETYGLGGYVPGRGEISIYYRERKGGTKFNIQDAPTGMSSEGKCGHPDSFDDRSLAFIASLLKIK